MFPYGGLFLDGSISSGEGDTSRTFEHGLKQIGCSGVEVNG